MKAIVLILLALFASGMLSSSEEVTNFGNNTEQISEPSIPGNTDPLPDIEVASGSIVPRLTCKEDGTHIMSVALEVRNRGAIDIEEDFKISLQDSAGNLLEGYWQKDFDGPLPLPSTTSDTTAISIPWPFTSPECTIQFSASLDISGEITEESEENNIASLDFAVPLSNIRINSISSTGAGDGVESIRVLVENTGCASIDIPFVLSVEDNSGNIQQQTIPSIPQGELTVTFEDWPSACATEERTFTVIADAGDRICETDGGDNTLTTSLKNLNPDLAIEATVDIECREDGKIRGAFKLTITNASEIDIQEDFFISIDDGKGWRLERQFGKELGGQLPIKQGETRELTVDWTRDFSIKPMIIDYPDLHITVDSKEQIDECDPTNNELFIPYSLQVPNLNLLSFTPTCVTDDYYQVILVVENNGGADITQDFAIQITDNDGKKQIKTFTEIEGTLPFKAGNRETVLFDTWEVDQAPALLQLECRLDIEKTLPETDSNDNNKRGSLQVFDMEITDFKAGTNTVSTKEGQVTQGFFSITVTNSGLSPITGDFSIQVVDREGWRTEKRFAENLGGILPIAPANSQTVTIPWNHDFSIHPPAYTFKNISVTIDSQSDICECDGTNNQAFTDFQYSDATVLLQITRSY
jgi:hypothetical protein